MLLRRFFHLKLLSEAKVGQLDMAVLAQQNVLRLQITVHDLFRVEVFQCQDDLAGIKEYLAFRESPLLSKVEKEAASTLIVQKKVQLL